ncbi:MAG TPA: hypothetical protein VK116_04800, partial [Planctomycetota bacterium]|nr:hypothetical protein [Planctomycetota bacterium]
MRRLPPILIAAGIAFGLWAIDAELRTSDAENADSPAETTRASAIEAPGADADESRPLITVRGPGTLEGRITDPDGQPIAGATLRWGPCRTLSDGEGRFALLPADGELTVEHDEYFPLHVQARDVAKLPADSDGILHLVLLSGHRLRGRVVGESGAPLAGVEVFLSADFFERETTTVLTDKDGAWTSPLLGPGPMRALFRDAEHRIARAEWSIDLHAPPPPIETKLEKGAPISIEVVDEDQRPLGDADVWLEEIAESGGVPVVRSRYLGRTGDLGELRTAIAKIERWAVRVRRAGYREERREIDDAKARQPIEIVLLEAPALEARAILATTGLPVRPTRVELEIATEERSHVESDGSTFEERISSRPPALASIESFRPVAHRGLLFQGLEDGRILVGLPRHAGRFRIVVHAAGHLHGVSPVVTYDGRRSPEPVVVRLEREERLEGLVHSRGEPVEGAEVELVALAGRDIGSV